MQNMDSLLSSVSVHQVCAVPGELRRGALDSLELELQIVVSIMWESNQNFLVEEQPMCLTAMSPLYAPFLSFM